MDCDRVPFDKGWGEEREALDVIPVGMPKENLRVDAFLSPGHQRGAQLARSGAAVEDQQIAVGGSQLDAGRVAAEVIRARPRRGDRTPRPPETYSHEAVPFV